jgi:hypothetical protein
MRAEKVVVDVCEQIHDRIADTDEFEGGSGGLVHGGAEVAVRLIRLRR